MLVEGTSRWHFLRYRFTTGKANPNQNGLVARDYPLCLCVNLESANLVECLLLVERPLIRSSNSSFCDSLSCESSEPKSDISIPWTDCRTI